VRVAIQHQVIPISQANFFGDAEFFKLFISDRQILGGNIPFRVIFRNARIARPKPGFWGQKARNAWLAARIASASPLHH
jgi:hypothetical protein